MSKIMPVLKPYNYKREFTWFYKQPIVNDPASPVVAFGVDIGEQLMYKPAGNEEEFKRELPGMREEAMNNLAAIQLEPNLQTGDNGTFAFLTGHEYSSEKLLDKAFMLSLHRTLNCENLLVGIPKRQYFVATAADKIDQRWFAAIVKKTYDEPAANKITNAVFLVNKGEIVGIAAAAFAQEDELPYVVSVSQNSIFLVQFTAITVEKLPTLLSEAFTKVVQIIVGTKKFGGQVHFIVPPTIELDEGVLSRCSQVMNMISNSTELRKLLVNLGLSPASQLLLYHHNKVIASSVEQPTTKHDFSDLSKEELIDAYYNNHAALAAGGGVEDLETKKALIVEFMKRQLPLPDVTKPRNDNKPWWKRW